MLLLVFKGGGVGGVLEKRWAHPITATCLLASFLEAGCVPPGQTGNAAGALHLLHVQVPLGWLF